ncbi:hypothetical protein Taro_000188, partial [Colocasia esculenta]|nr:hypothetical protein [Colocasia esculenta]
MKGECPEIKKDKYKKNNKLKKPKAMIATWSDEDQSEDEEENSSSSANEELCFMANSSDGKDSQRKGAQEIHKDLMAKKSFNESRKSTIQKTLALTTHSMSSEHSASSSEHKNSNGSTRLGTYILDSSMYSNSDSDEDEGMSHDRLIEFCEKMQNLNAKLNTKNRDLKKTLKHCQEENENLKTEVEKLNSEKENLEDEVQICQNKVYTNLSQVVSTQSTCVLTRSACVLTRSACVLTQSASRVDTLNGKRALTLPEEAFWQPKGAFQILLHLQKLQAILSRGRTWESREISGEKLIVLGKGADPTEEAHEKKDFWHFRCHQSRASPIVENLHRFPSRLLN